MRILISAGPTREYFDPVRFISNGSSGKMGYSLAAAACEKGHEVVLVSGPVSLAAPPSVELVRVTTAKEMLAACCEKFDSSGAAIMTAAVSDWRPTVTLKHKAPKQTSKHIVELEPTEDICAILGANKGSRVVVGFAVQDEDRYARAEEKMVRKNCDAIVLNGPETLGSETASVEIKTVSLPWSNPITGDKHYVARAIIEKVEELFAGQIT